MEAPANAEQMIMDHLKAKQKELGLGTVAFAKHLGISPALWVLSRDGTRRLNVRLAAAAAETFPELEPLVGVFLRHELPTRNMGSAGQQGASDEEPAA